MDTSTTTTLSPAERKQAWKDRAVHQVTLNTGQVAQIRIPSLARLMEEDALPEELRVIATLEVVHPRGAAGALADQVIEADRNQDTAERERLEGMLSKLGDLQKRLIVAGLVDPQLTIDDLDDPDFPQEDLELLAAIISRERVYDARGVRIGIEPIDRFQRFRDKHECGPDCPACKALQDDVSTADLGAL
jgi:hypothetical protein